MTYLYIHENSAQIKAVTKSLMKGKWLKSFGIMLLGYIVSSLPSMVYNNVGIQIPAVEWALTFYGLCIFGLMSVGEANYFLRTVRNQHSGPADLFIGVNFFGKSLLLGLFLYAMIVMLSGGYLLIAIFMLVALLRYSMSFFVLADDPSKRVTRCVSESSVMMRVNKMKLFRLCLSFIGWFFVALLPGSALVSAVVNPLMASGVADMDTIYAEAFAKLGAYSFAITIPVVLVGAYFLAALAVFYELATGNLRFASQAETDIYNEAGIYSEPAGGLADSPFEEEPIVVDVAPEDVILPGEYGEYKEPENSQSEDHTDGL